MTKTRAVIRRLRDLALAGLVLVIGGGCVGAAIQDRAKLVDPAMQFDSDPGFVSVRDKIEAAREGAFGGFGAARAGGCACQ